MDDEFHSRPRPAAQEVDVWWGAYSGWTLLPSLVVCVVLTGAIVWGTWTFVERRNVQWTFWSLAGLLWLLQLVRGSRRVFGINYRLTSKRLFIEHGHWRPRRVWVNLADIVEVSVRPVPWGAWTGVGAVVVRTDQGKRHVLKGVYRPQEVAGLIRGLSEHVREPQPTPVLRVDEVPVSRLAEPAPAAPDGHELPR
ncbi:MAG: PH domain-containing protein [Gemmataceae bacterium]|nr:PH domain-containing protein [Gemmataceae bacterium]